MYGFEGVGLSEVQLSISELSVVGGGGGGPDKRTSWSDLVGVRQILKDIAVLIINLFAGRKGGGGGKELGQAVPLPHILHCQ